MTESSEDRMAQARQLAETLTAIPVNYPTREADTFKALLAFAQDVAFKARCAEGERIARRCFSELPLDPNVSDGNESADPADHIVPCVKAALTSASAAKDWQPSCEACDAGYRLADTGVHYDDARGGWTWGVCRKRVFAAASAAKDEMKAEAVRLLDGLDFDGEPASDMTITGSQYVAIVNLLHKLSESR